MKHGTHRRKRHINRKAVFVGLLVLVIVISGAIAIRFGPITSADNRATKSLVDTKTKIITLTKELNVTFAGNGESVSKKAALSTFVSNIKKQVESVCSEERTLVYYSLITKHDSCESAFKALTDVTSATNNLLSFLNDEETLAALLPVHTTTLSSVESYDLWKRTSELLSTAKTGDQALNLKKSLQAASEKYRDAWDSLVKADTNKDEAAFTKAEESVNTAYYSLTTQSTVAETTLKELTTSFNAKYALYTSLKN